MRFPFLAISGLYIRLRCWRNSGAGVGVRVGLLNLFNDTSEEAKLLAFQLDLLKQHLGVEKLSNYKFV